MLDLWLKGKSRVRRGKFPLDESGKPTNLSHTFNFFEWEGIVCIHLTRYESSVFALVGMPFTASEN